MENLFHKIKLEIFTHSRVQDGVVVQVILTVGFNQGIPWFLDSCLNDFIKYCCIYCQTFVFSSSSHSSGSCNMTQVKVDSQRIPGHFLSPLLVLDSLLIAETEKQSALAARVSTWKQRIEQNMEEQFLVRILSNKKRAEVQLKSANKRPKAQLQRGKENQGLASGSPSSSHMSVKLGKVVVTRCTPDSKRRRRSRLVDPDGLNSAG
ncbi:hypothetical protein QVD17_40570 [Tagetes erecta]|uniref:Uncharacterized protein n=1 Tax=Tagetes erecta TaxID=13708 RepID=A0AAD8NI07_TARER|nr:hypothetical protein QVD17_40570 [Tagetes erecta]